MLPPMTDSDVPGQDRQTLACGVLSGVFLISAVVLSRRVTGDVSGLSSEWAACGIGALSLAISSGCLAVPDLFDRVTGSALRLFAVAGCLLPGLILGATLLPSGSSQALTVLLSLYAGAVTLRLVFDREPVSRIVVEPVSAPTWRAEFVPAPAAPPQPVPSPAFATELEFASSEIGNPSTHPGDCPETTQWMSRSSQDGCDVIEGAFRVAFASGQRHISIHLPFAPALPATPEIECEPIDGDAEVEVRVTSTQPYGVRVEITRTSEFELCQTVQLGYLASAASQPAAAMDQSTASELSTGTDPVSATDPASAAA